MPTKTGDYFAEASGNLNSHLYDLSADLLFSPSNSPDRQQNKSGGDEKKKIFLITQGGRGGKRNCIYLVLRTPSGAHALHFQIHCTENI